MKIYYSKYKYIEIVIRRRIAFEKFRNNKFRKDGVAIYISLGLTVKQSYDAVNTLRRFNKKVFKTK